jgi:hypothetical protein
VKEDLTIGDTTDLTETMNVDRITARTIVEDIIGRMETTDLPMEIVRTVLVHMITAGVAVMEMPIVMGEDMETDRMGITTAHPMETIMTVRMGIMINSGNTIVPVR